MQKRTRVVLSIPWDDEEQDHPAVWDYGVLLDLQGDVHLVDFEDVTERGEPDVG